MKVVINDCYGGFGLSEKARKLYKQLSGNTDECFYEYHLDRKDPNLVKVVEILGREADGKHAELKIVDIPDGIQYTIEEYDGIEHIAEKHRTWS